MKRMARTAVIGMAALGVACAEIPPEAVAVNKDVSIGIGRLGEQGAQLVDAVRQTARAAVQEQFDNFYDEADAMVRMRHNLAPDDTLTDDQRRDVAGIVHLMIEDAFARIDAKAVELKATLAENVATLKDANDQITPLLESASSLIEKRRQALKSVSALVPLPGLDLLTQGGISEVVDGAIKAVKEKFQ